MIALHAVEDFTLLNVPGNLPLGVRLAYCAGYAAYGWVLSRRLDPQRRAALA